MNSTYQVQDDSEKEEILGILRSTRDTQLNELNWESFWHTARMYQSLKMSVIDKQIFVNDITNIKFVLTSFIRIKNSTSVNFEIWLRPGLKNEEIDEIVNIFLEIVDNITKEGKICFFRSLRQCIYLKLQAHVDEYEFKINYTRDCIGMFSDLALKNKIDFPSKKFLTKRLETDAVERIIRTWKYGHMIDIDWVTKSVRDVFGLGLWDTDSGDLIGQFIHMCTGTFGALSIDSAYRGLGLGRLMVQEMIEACKSMDMVLLVEVEDDNIVSQRLFSSMDFKTLTHSFYIVFNRGDTTVQPGTDF